MGQTSFWSAGTWTVWSNGREIKFLSVWTWRLWASFLNFDCMRIGSKKPTSFHGPTSFATPCQHKPSTTHRFQSLDLIRFTDNTRYVEFVDSNSPTHALLRQAPTWVSQLPSWRWFLADCRYWLKFSEPTWLGATSADDSWCSTKLTCGWRFRSGDDGGWGKQERSVNSYLPLHTFYRSLWFCPSVQTHAIHSSIPSGPRRGATLVFVKLWTKLRVERRAGGKGGFWDGRGQLPTRMVSHLQSYSLQSLHLHAQMVAAMFWGEEEVR